MKAAAHWPKYLYLISPSSLIAGPHSNPANMGTKAYNLLRMAQAGLPVPPALVIGTHFTNNPSDSLTAVFSAGLPALESASDLQFGDARKPLLVSVRSGAASSMPGMMDTLLNIGLSDQTLSGLLRQTGNPRLVWDAYRRLIASYGEVVAGLPAHLFQDELELACAGKDERQLDFNELRQLTRRFLLIYQRHAGYVFPQNAHEQLSGAIQAVFASWFSERAKSYRELNHISETSGTAVTIQTMVFGNSGGHSGAGVGFTRSPVSGERQLWVDFLINAQGEDVVSGRRNACGHQSLANIIPDVWHKLHDYTEVLEHVFGDMQDFEFTVQEGALYLLQTRHGKRTPLATARIALDLLDEGLISTDTAAERLAHLHEEDLVCIELTRQDNPDMQICRLGEASPACSGIASGEIVLDYQRAASRKAEGIPVILVRQDAQTHDFTAIEISDGLLTQRGARTSHAAVIARQLAKVCLTGCENMKINLSERQVSFGSILLNEGDMITLDANEGVIYAGQLTTTTVPDQTLQKRLQAFKISQTSKMHHKRHK